MAEPEAEAVPRAEAEELEVTVTPGCHLVDQPYQSSFQVRQLYAVPAAQCGPSCASRLQQLRTEKNGPRCKWLACWIDAWRMSCQIISRHTTLQLQGSGSMSGQKLAFAKKACAKLAKHLELGDALHFIVYDHQVQTVFQNGDLSENGKEELKARIHQAGQY